MENGNPVLCSYDYIGTESLESFVTGGTAGDNLLGTAESYYRPGLAIQELEDVLANCLVSACDRDCLSGWSGAVYIM